MRAIVGESPVQIFPAGVQGRASIYNEGPSTIYVDSVAAPNPSLSVAVPPTGILHWDRSRPLLACTAGGDATVRVTLDGVLADASRAAVQNIVSQQTIPLVAPGGTHAFDQIETGSYQTLSVRGYSPAVTATGDNWNWEFVWYDDNFNELYRESIRAWVAFPDTFAIDIPVRGRYCTVQMTLGGATSIGASVRFIGTSRLLPASSFMGTPVSPDPGLSAFVSRGSVMLFQWDKTIIYRLPSWGKRITVNGWANNVTVATVFAIKHLNGSIFQYMTVPVAAGADQSFSFDVVVPNSQPIMLDYESGTFSRLDVFLTWTDYDGDN